MKSYLKYLAISPIYRTLFLASLLGVATRCHDAVAAEIDSLEQLNLSFREAHHKSAAITLEKTSPIIVAEFESLVLFRRGTRTETEPLPRFYHDLKSLSHSPLAVYLIATRNGGATLSEDLLSDLRDVRQKLLAATNVLNERGFSEEQLARQKQIIVACERFIDAATANRSLPKEQLRDFLATTRPLMMANAADAAKLQIDTYDKYVAAWRKSLSANEWSQLRVVVMGSALPRRGNLTVQFFAKVLDLRGECSRLLYAEALFEEPKALRLLANYDVDAAMANAFFNDPTRLHRDLLSDAATQYLADHGNALATLKVENK